MADLQDFEGLGIPDRRERLLAWLTPTRKLVIVGGLTLVPALGIGVILNGLFAAAPPRSSVAIASKPIPESPIHKPEPRESREVDRLKAEVALSDQRQMFEKLQVQTKSRSGEVVKTLSPVATKPIPTPLLPSLPPVPPRQAPPDLRTLAYLGSSQESGPSSYGSRGTSTGSLPPAPLPVSYLASRPVAPIEPEHASSGRATSLDPELEATITSVLPTPVEGKLSRRLHRSIPAASLGVGVLERPILVEQTDRPGPATEVERYIVVLSEPLAAEDGRVLLEAGTRVLVGTPQISPNGLVSMQAVALRLEGRELPLQSVSVRAIGGLPLQAANRDKGGEIAGLDAGQALLKGAEDGLAILNRPTRTGQASGYSGSSSSTTYGTPNSLAAMGSGIFGELTQVIRQRNQQAVHQILDRPSLWLIPGGTAVELLFARELSL